jgi:hypothetical protein
MPGTHPDDLHAIAVTDDEFHLHAQRPVLRVDALVDQW